MREATIRSQLGHLQIVRPDYFEKGLADPYKYLLPGDTASMERVSNHPGVKMVAPRLAFSGLVSFGDTTLSFSGEGIDPEKERPLTTRISFKEGRDLESNEEQGAILGEGLAKNLGVKPGDQIVLLGTKANGGTSAIEVKIAGIFFTINKEFDEYALRLPISLARKLIQTSGATSWVTLLDETDTTVRAATELQSKLPSAEYQVITWSSLADFYNKTVVLFNKQVQVVKIIIGIIIVLAISNTQTMNILERTTEIGTSLAIGSRRSEILNQFLLEGAMIGIAGGIVGVVAGYLLGIAISSIGIPMPPPPGMARGYMGEILIGIPLIGDALLLSCATAILASIMPAWRASKLNVVDALRCNQ